MSTFPKGFNSNLEYAQHLEKEAAIEKQKERFDKEEVILEATYGESKTAEATRGNKITIKNDWEYLRSMAKAQFPEGAEHLGLSPRNRLVAIAFCFGWTQLKIANASGVSRSTVKTWLKRPDMQLFINEFNMKRGTEGSDVMTKFTELEYKAVQCVDKILSDPDQGDSAKRLKLDASKWVFERNRGKPNQPIEHRGDSLKKMITELGKISRDFVLSEEEEKELFEPEEVH